MLTHPLKLKLGCPALHFLSPKETHLPDEYLFSHWFKLHKVVEILYVYHDLSKNWFSSSIIGWEALFISQLKDLKFTDKNLIWDILISRNKTKNIYL